MRTTSNNPEAGGLIDSKEVDDRSVMRESDVQNSFTTYENKNLSHQTIRLRMSAIEEEEIDESTFLQVMTSQHSNYKSIISVNGEKASEFAVDFSQKRKNKVTN